MAGAEAYGGVTTDTLFQAASFSKTVAAVAALRLVQEGRRETSLTRDHPVALRGLLSMTGGIRVPGYVGYPVGSPLPDLVQILNGAPTANSPPVTVAYTPGSRYVYSGGGFEMVQALTEAVTGQTFEAAVSSLVLEPLGMGHTRSPSHCLPGAPAMLRGAHGGWSSDWRRLARDRGAGGRRAVVDADRSRPAAGGSDPGPSGRSRPAATRHGPRHADAGRQLRLWPGRCGERRGPGPRVHEAWPERRYQSYMLFFPNSGQGAVVMTNSDNGSLLAEALIRRSAEVYHWPPLGPLHD